MNNHNDEKMALKLVDAKRKCYFFFIYKSGDDINLVEGDEIRSCVKFALISPLINTIC